MDAVFRRLAKEAQQRMRAAGIPEAQIPTVEQLGPHSTFGDVGAWARALGTIAPLAIPGVGLVAGAAMGAGTSALTGGNVLEGGARGAAAAGANKALLGGQGAAGVSNLLNTGSVSSLPGVLRAARSAIGSGGAAPAAGAAPAGGGGGWSPSDLVSTGLGVLGTVQGAQRQGQANALRERGLSQVQPGAVPMPDLSAIYANPGNPYSRAAVRPPTTGSALDAARASLRGY